MDDEARRRDEWTTSLQLFLLSRLRTPPYAAAVRSNPLVSTPSLVFHSQSLIDGIVWSLNDHPSWTSAAWGTLLNHLKATGELYMELRAELAKAQEEANELVVGSRLYRERMYRAHAAVQDVYLAFCALDALPKRCVGATGAVVRPNFERELPALVSEHFPVLVAQGSVWSDDAAEEYRAQFLALLSSWTSGQYVSADTVRRLEEHVRHRLAGQRAHETSLKRSRGADVADGLKLILGSDSKTSASGVLPSSAGGGAAASVGPARTPEAAERTLRSFLRSIFPLSRSAAARYRCSHCGAALKNDASKNAHYRYHFCNHNIMRPEDKVVRLMYPSASDFIEHVGDIEKTGFFTKSTDLLEDAYKNGAKGEVKVRRIEDVIKKE